MHTLLSKHWCHIPQDEVADLLDTHPQNGLDVFEVKHRQERFGLNAITPKKGKSPLIRFLLQFHNPLIYILLAASVITAVLKKDLVDALVIFGVVLINAIISYIQEDKAEKAIEALSRTLSTEATVVRAGSTQRVKADDLVPGDLVLLQSGDKVPADLRLIRSRDLQVAEAALTGESTSVQKAADLILPHDTPLADRKNMAFASTLVTYGQAGGIVVATGDYTEVGRISSLISSAHDLRTPLTRKIAQFSRLLMVAVLILAVLAFGIGILRDQPAIDTLLAAIALAVAAIPEGLPAAITVTLAIGVSRMARKRAIIRKLPAVEALGSTTVICSDKTGTLTQNQMTVQQIAVGGKIFNVTGVGYAPEGHIVDCDTPYTPDAVLMECLRAGLLCNDSRILQKEGRWDMEGDPTESALVVSALKAGLSLEKEQMQTPRLDVIPFESQHQYMATLHDTAPNSSKMVYIKGSTDAILDQCTFELDPSGRPVPIHLDNIRQLETVMATQGLRVLAFARKEVPPQQASIGHEDISSGLVFLGLQGMIDPPRPEAIKAVHACQTAGIQVKMITGDHALTAMAIAKQIGLNGTSGSTPIVLTGRQLAELTDAELIDAADRTAVFARVSPEQKLRLVEALQARRHVVAMTGDGVNDAPALKQSDIGVAMGITGTDVSKEAADMVLTDDNFATIEAAVEEGRGVFDNLTKIIAWTLPTNLGGGLVILLAILTGIALPILPVQILWINMVTVAVLGLVLAMEAKEADIMLRPPRIPNTPILTRALIWRIVIVGLIILAGAYGLFEWWKRNGASLAEARTIAVNVVIFVEVFYLLNCRSLTQSIFRIGVFSNRWVIAGIMAMVLLQMLFTYAPFMNEIMSTAPIGLEAWGQIMVVSLIGYVIIEIEKWLRRRVATRDRRSQ